MRVAHVRLKFTALLVFTAACLGIFAYLYVAAGGRVPLSDRYEVTVHVPNAFQLVPNADVRAAGVKIGTVETIDSTDGRQATVKIAVDKSHAPIRQDARVLVRTKTLVGENYLDLQPGSAAAPPVPDGGSLPLSRAEDAVQLDQILSAMDAPTRASVRRDLQELGGGLRDSAPDLNRLFGAARPTLATGGRALAILDAQRGEVARVLQNTGQVLGAIGARRDDVRRLATAAKTTADAVAGRDAKLRALLDALPGTLDQVRTSAVKLGGFSGRATPVTADLRASARDLGPVVRDLGPAASGARRVLNDLPAMLKVADPLLSRLRTFSGSASPAVSDLNGLLQKLNPALAHLSPFDRELGAFFTNVGSAMDVTDAVGHVSRVHVEFDEGSLDNLGASGRKALDALEAAGAVSEIHQLRSNPYPAPGTVGTPQAFDGRVAQVPAGR